MSMGRPFDRKQFIQNIDTYIAKGYGSYSELIQLTIRDIIEIKISLESKRQEEELGKALGGALN